MATTAPTVVPRYPMRTRVGFQLPLWAAIVGSRLLVVAAGVGGALVTNPVQGWQVFDPQRLSTSLGPVGNVLISSSFRWDSVRYVSLAEHGYTSAASTVSFPLYSLLIRGLSWIVLSPVVAALLISVVAFVIGCALLHRLACEELGVRRANATLLLLAFAPLSFFFTAAYTESLFFALSVGSFYLAHHQRLVPAGIIAAAAALTRVEGVLLVAPLAFIYWRECGWALGFRRLWRPGVLALTLPVLALLGFFWYLHSQGWGWFAPIANQNFVNHARSMLGTPAIVWRAFNDGTGGLALTFDGIRPIEPGLGGPFSFDFANFVDLIVFAVAMAALFATWQRLPKEYVLYSALALVVCTTSGVAGLPLYAFDRYMLPIFPLWMGAGAWLHERRLMPSVMQFSMVALVFYTVEFARWVPAG